MLRTAGIPVNSPTLLSASNTLSPSLLPNLAIFNRIYIGSIFFELSEAEIGTVFSVFGPLRSVQMMVDPATKKHRGYGFLEFETPDAAALAQLSMDNADFGGRRIKVGRPNNFPNDLPPGVPRPVPNRIYVANVHELIQEEEFESIFQAFGPLRACILVPDAKLGKQHRGYGYVEFEAVADAINAMSSLANFELAGRALKIGKTVVGGVLPAGMRSQRTPHAAPRPEASQGRRLEASRAASGPPSQQRVLPSAVLRAAQQINAAIGSEATAPCPPEPVPDAQPKATDRLTVLAMNNLAEPSELVDEQLKHELLEDILAECSKLGHVADAIKTHVPAAACTEAWFFVKYQSEPECSAAFRVMHGRWFGGRQVVARIISESVFDSDQFSRIFEQ